MIRHYATLTEPDGPWQIHYREAGSGPPCVLLHPSPLSSAALAPTLELLSPIAHCVAWDTPGYGNSDPLPQSWDAQDLTPYVSALAAFIDALGLKNPLLYGSATGAQIAIEFSKRHPERCGGLLLENAALFGEEERAAIVEDYFPDIHPRDDGSHLTALWRMARNSMRYFPWYEQSPQADRRGGFPDASIVTTVVRDYLLAGPDYARAYRAAFANESLEQLSGVRVPTRIVLWDDGILGDYSERLSAAELPQNITIQRTSSGMPARMQGVHAAATELITLIHS